MIFCYFSGVFLSCVEQYGERKRKRNADSDEDSGSIATEAKIRKIDADTPKAEEQTKSIKLHEKSEEESEEETDDKSVVILDYLPSKPPYLAYLFKEDGFISEEEVKMIFDDFRMKVSHLELRSDNAERNLVFLELINKIELIKALALNGSTYNGEKIFVCLPEVLEKEEPVHVTVEKARDLPSLDDIDANQMYCVVCDTNVFLHHIKCIKKLVHKDTTINGSPLALYIPFKILQEIDGVKRKQGCYWMSKRAVRMIIDIQEKRLKNCIFQKIEEMKKIKESWEENNDDDILQTCRTLLQKFGKEKVVLVTDDVMFSAKTNVEGIIRLESSDIIIDTSDIS